MGNLVCQLKNHRLRMVMIQYVSISCFNLPLRGFCFSFQGIFFLFLRGGCCCCLSFPSFLPPFFSVFLLFFFPECICFGNLQCHQQIGVRFARDFKSDFEQTDADALTSEPPGKPEQTDRKLNCRWLQVCVCVCVCVCVFFTELLPPVKILLFL